MGETFLIPLIGIELTVVELSVAVAAVILLVFFWWRRAWIDKWLRNPALPEEEMKNVLQMPPEEIEHRREEHKEASLTARRTFLALVGACLSCLAILSDFADADLVATGKKVKIPVIGNEVEFQLFLVFGPVVIVALSIYMHVFLARVNALSPGIGQPIPTLFNLPGRWPASITVLAFYVLPVATLLAFMWVARLHSSSPLIPLFLATLTLVLGVTLAVLAIRRYGDRVNIPAPWLQLVMLVSGILAVAYFADHGSTVAYCRGTASTARTPTQIFPRQEPWPGSVDAPADPASFRLGIEYAGFYRITARGCRRGTTDGEIWFDPVLELYTEGNPDTPVATNDDAGLSDGDFRFEDSQLFRWLEPESYFVFVREYRNSRGTFGLAVQSVMASELPQVRQPPQAGIRDLEAENPVVVPVFSQA